MHKKHSSFIANLQKPSLISILSVFGYIISICLFLFPLFRNTLFQQNSLEISKLLTDNSIIDSKQIRLVSIMVNNREIKFDNLIFKGNWQKIQYVNSQYMETQGNEAASAFTLLPFNTSRIEIWLSSGLDKGKAKVIFNDQEQHIFLTESENGERLVIFPNTLFFISQLFKSLLIVCIFLLIILMSLLLLTKFSKYSLSNLLLSFARGFFPGLIGGFLATSFTLSPNTLNIANRSLFIQKATLVPLILVSSIVSYFLLKHLIIPFFQKLPLSRSVYLGLFITFLSILNYMKYYPNNLRIEFFYVHFFSYGFSFLLLGITLILLWKKYLKDIPVYAIICIFLVVITYWLFLTQGKQGQILTHDHLGIDTGYYDYLGLSILHGKLDVPSDVIADEAFVYNDKTYGYFGVAPALLRLPLNWLFPDLFGKWTSTFLIVACFSNQIFAFLIIKQFISIWMIPEENARTKLIIVMFLLITGLGTTNIFLTRPSVYVEASMLGSSFALAFFYYFLLYIYKQTFKYLLLISALCFLTFHTRQTSGLGVLVALGLFVFFFILNRIGVHIFKILPEETNPPSSNDNVGIIKTPNLHILIIVFVVLFSGLLQVGMNYYRFGTLFDSTPFNHYIAFKESPELMPKQPYYTWPYVRFALDTLLFPERITFIKEPLFHIETYPQKDYGFMTPSNRNPAAFAMALPVLMFPLFIFSIVGVYSVWKYKKDTILVMLCPLLNGLALFFAGGVEQRHSHDFFPFFVIAGAAGLTWLMVRCGISRKLQVTLLSLLCLFGLLSIYLNIVNVLV
jgi:hypothetical protein